jgi:uncharacterized phage protein (TIGR01671 family)
MNDLEFRAWDIKNKKMYNVKEISFDYKEIVIKRACEKEEEIIKNGGHYCSSCDPEYDDFLLFKDAELMQYIGKKDKNDQKIYEEDLVRYVKKGVVINIEDQPFDIIGIGKIEYNEYECGYYINDEKEEQLIKLNWPDEIEVIGNKFEPPELINE